MKEKILVALGGNALGNTPEEQLAITKKTAKPLVDFIEQGYQLIICHGNGPQVGLIQNAFSAAHKTDANISLMDLPECTAMSQGYIGYHLQLALLNELKQRQISKSVSCVVSQTLVDKNDPGFKNPTKPVGPFYTKEQAEQIAQQSGYTMIEDSGRGYRRVVASPKPVDIIEKQTILDLVNQDHIVIATGGGGVPVVEENGLLHGASAVIDKDLASSALACALGVEKLIILTAVDYVAIRFNTPEQKNLEKLTLAQCQQYIDQGEFAKGSMLPKVLSAMDFVQKNKGKQAIITSLEKATQACQGLIGTVISA